jgi:hypothetical protein
MLARAEIGPKGPIVDFDRHPTLTLILVKKALIPPKDGVGEC